jgi:hypothetical protein
MRSFDNQNLYDMPVGSVVWMPGNIKQEEWRLCDGSIIDPIKEPKYKKFCDEFGTQLPDYTKYFFAAQVNALQSQRGFKLERWFIAPNTGIRTVTTRETYYDNSYGSAYRPTSRPIKRTRSITKTYFDLPDDSWFSGEPEEVIEPFQMVSESGINLTQALRLTGYFFPPKTGYYSFKINSVGGSRIFLNDQLLLDNWALTNNTPSTKDIFFMAGEPHKFVFEYFFRPTVTLKGESYDIFGQTFTKQQILDALASGTLVASGDYYDENGNQIGEVPTYSADDVMNELPPDTITLTGTGFYEIGIKKKGETSYAEMPFELLYVNRDRQTLRIFNEDRLKYYIKVI